MLQRKLDRALQEVESKDNEIEQLKNDMKDMKARFSGEKKYAQDKMQIHMTKIKAEEIQGLKDRLDDLQRKYDYDVPRFKARIADLEQELRYTRWVTDLHTYLVSVEEDLQLIADRLSRFLDPTDRQTLYSTRDPTDISVAPTLRWASHVYREYYGMSAQFATDMETSLNKWRTERNIYAHRSKTDTLTQRDRVLENAVELDGALAKMITELGQENDQVLSKVAKTAYAEAFGNRFSIIR